MTDSLPDDKILVLIEKVATLETIVGHTLASITEMKNGMHRMCEQLCRLNEAKATQEGIHQEQVDVREMTDLKHQGRMATWTTWAGVIGAVGLLCGILGFLYGTWR